MVSTGATRTLGVVVGGFVFESVVVLLGVTNDFPVVVEVIAGLVLLLEDSQQTIAKVP